HRPAHICECFPPASRSLCTALGRIPPCISINPHPGESHLFPYWRWPPTHTKPSAAPCSSALNFPAARLAPSWNHDRNSPQSLPRSSIPALRGPVVSSPSPCVPSLQIQYSSNDHGSACRTSIPPRQIAPNPSENSSLPSRRVLRPETPTTATVPDAAAV